MRWIWFNRLIYFLALVGLFISAILWLSHIFSIELPCSTGGGCAKIATSKYATLAGVPVAAFGAMYDLVILLVCITRIGRPASYLRSTGVAIWLASAVAFGISAYLLYLSVNELHILCEWCLAHAIVVTLILVVGGIQSSLLSQSEDIEPARGSELRLMAWAATLPLIVTAGYGSFLYARGGRIAVTIVGWRPEIMSERDWSRGPKEAPVTIVEFGDLQCSHCGRTGNYIKEMMERHPGKIREVFRHYPLYQIHPYAYELALAAEWAGKKGKFWNFVDAVFENQDAGEKGKLLGYATKAGLDATEMQKFLSQDYKDKKTEKYKAFMEMYADYKDGVGLGVTETPTVFVIVNEPGKPQEILKTTNMGGLQTILGQGNVAQLLGEKVRSN